jgi:hypothetical protein
MARKKEGTISCLLASGQQGVSQSETSSQPASSQPPALPLPPLATATGRAQPAVSRLGRDPHVHFVILYFNLYILGDLHCLGAGWMRKAGWIAASQ